MMICNPHNPVGRAWSREELETNLCALCRRYGVTLVADEIHSGFVYGENRVHFTFVAGYGERC